MEGGGRGRRAYTLLLIVQWHRGLRKGVFLWRYHSLHCVYVCVRMSVCLCLSNQIVCRRPYYVMQLCLSAVLHVWRGVEEACDCCDDGQGKADSIGWAESPDFCMKANEIWFERTKRGNMKAGYRLSCPS